MKRDRAGWIRAAWAVFAGGLAVVVVAAGPADGQTPEYDLSGLQRFWEVAAVLERGQEPTHAQWRALLEHPGYAHIERLGRRGAAVRACMPLVFDPSRRAELAVVLEDGHPLERRVCPHLDEARERRGELRAFEAELGDAGELAAAVQRTAAFLPAGALDGAPPPVHVILFESNGFGGAALALDALVLMDAGPEERLGYLAHEFHHGFRGRIDRVDVDEEDPSYLVVAALASLAEEGIASMLDKRRWLTDDYVERLSGDRRRTALEFRAHFAASHQALAALDGQLRALAADTVDPADMGRAIKRGLPWGGHPTGLYMALAIQDAGGPGALAALAADPLEFLVRYQEVASGDATLYRFSAPAEAYLRRLSARY